MSYRPTRYYGPNDDFQRLLEWAHREYEAIAQSFTTLDLIRLTEITVTPAKPRDGDVRFADGTNWNPGGTGRGFYGYYTGAWHKLG